MNRFHIIIIFFLALYFSNCTKDGKVEEQLDNVEYMLRDNFLDSANVALIAIDPLTEEDSAHFFVLRAEIAYRQRQVPNIDELNYSINYYEKHIDNSKLANAYYYKACAYFFSDVMPNEVFVFLKKAEYLSEKTNDNYLQNKIYSALTYANGAKNRGQEALKYAKKEYLTAKKNFDNRDIAYALIRLASCHKLCGDSDSANFYTKQCEKLVSEVDDSDKAFYYNLLGGSIIEQNTDSALHYYKLALKYENLPETYMNIADIYYENGDTAKWKKYCDSALADAWYETKKYILAEIAQTNYESNKIEGYKQATDTLIKTMEEYYNYEKNNFAIEIQKKFDFEKQQTEYEKNVWILVAVISILTTICLSSVIYIRHNKRTIKQLEVTNSNLYVKIQNSDSNIKEYRKQLDFLQKQNEEIKSNSNNLADVIANNQAMIASLQKEIDNLNNLHTEYVETGRTIFEKIQNNLPIDNMKTKFANVLYYFETMYPERTDIFASYSKLTIENKVFLIIDDALEKTDAETAKILGISASTVRSRRTKLKEKLS